MLLPDTPHQACIFTGQQQGLYLALPDMAYISDDEDLNFPHQRFHHPDDADDMDMNSDADSDEEAEEVCLWT